MAKLKLGAIEDDKPVKISVELPAALHRDLLAYAEILGRESGQAIEPAKLVAPMVARFMATDRGFLKAKRTVSSGSS
ncbi:conserved hypothetical protein [Xanthobacter versatilis]|jgi:hypothetical protein|uniref:DUF2274 domain-containing protein n=1 Tax=Xanthobacter autotrophicus (strain ATCC BAA-1158 / Py2) TaxID=78245 RepID=A7ID98_XANP2|nr:DUF2274 domain-containing protein [Filomicrobium sp.]ABS65991.1 conserved hypothetical protein [Xanthobacter autotrophicus Py2]MCV0370602.1 DUF2274 domain-containing protein [Filomicrobium sp.]